MKQTMKIISLFLALLCILSLVACDVGGGESAESTSESTSESMEETESLSSEELAEREEQNKFIAGIGGVSETYTGGVSVESYPTKEEAAAAYVENEVVGEKNVSVVNTVLCGALSEQEIQDLKLPAEEAEGIIGVDEIEVEYREEGIEEVARKVRGTLNTTKKVKVYIIKFEDECKYYTPCPITGDTINKSYYDSVFNNEKYTNCTYNTSMTMIMAVQIPGEATESIKVTSTQKLSFSENAILLEQTAGYSAAGQEVAPQTIYAYIAKEGDRMVCYISMDNQEWIEGDLTTVGFTSFEELTPFYDQYLDYSYFTKTDFGFELSEANARQFIAETLQDTVSMETYESFDLDMFAKYYVSQGVLSGFRMEMDMQYSVSNGPGEGSSHGTLAVVGETTVTNYGTTVVEKPFD